MWALGEGPALSELGDGRSLWLGYRWREEGGVLLGQRVEDLQGPKCSGETSEVALTELGSHCTGGGSQGAQCLVLPGRW